VCAFPTIHVIAGERGNRREYYSGEDNMMARGEWQVLDRNQFHSHEGLDAHQVDVARRRWVEQRMQPEMNRYRDYIPRNMENLHWGPYADRLFERQQQVMNERGYELRQMGDTWVRVNRNAPRTEQPNVRPQIPRPRYEPPVYQPPYRPEWVIDVTGEDLRGGEVRGEDLRGGLFGLGAVAGAGALAGYTAEQKKKAFMLLAVVGGGLLGCAGLLKYKESKQAEYERDIAAIEGRSISRTEKDRLIRERSTWRQKYLPGWMKRMFKMRVDWSRA